ncbi:MAG: carboxypeptidase regulatory-like domain-containing protein [Terriglobia bacterium]|nr:carboxypeptidase regulatory-like domain-containing protein [Terriglobia bacterium]
MQLPHSVRLLLLCVLVGTAAFAQSPNGTISGIVLDPSGAAIAHADIQIVNDATGVRYPGTTNSEGIYAVPNLPPGAYRIQVAKVGFKTLIKPDIVLNVQDALAINFTLPVGAFSETVTVQGGAPLVKTESASVGTVIDRQFVENLPLNGRSFNTLLQLTPGVVIAPSSSASGQYSISGQRATSNNFIVDGASANFGVSPYLGLNGTGAGTSQAFSAIGGTSSLVSVDALQEFRIETSSFAPEFGRTPGGQVVLTTRSGTNEFHGGLFEYFRNDVMDANDWFANQAHQPRPPERHNDFGGFLGGPILRRNTFFFASYEGARLRLPNTQTKQVPSESARASAPAELAPFLNAFSDPNGSISANGYTAQFTGGYSNSATLDAGSIRIDHKFNDRFSIFGRYNDAPSQFATPLGGASSLFLTTVNTKTLTVNSNMTFSSRILNNLRANFSTQSSGLAYSTGSHQTYGATALDPNLIAAPLQASDVLVHFGTLDTTASFYVGPDGNNRTRQVNLADDLAITVGLHQLKFGGDYRAIFLNENPAHYIVNASASSVQSLLTTGQASLSVSEFLPSRFLAQSLSLYGQDVWQATPRLVVTYGLRWELSPAPSPRGSTTVTGWRNVTDPSTISLAPVGSSLWSTRHANFAPRLGVSYKLSEKGDFVLRGGVGSFYDLGLGSASNLGYSFPNSANVYTASVGLPMGDVQPYLPTISLQPPYQGLISGFDPNLKLPRSYQWNVTLEKSFGERQAISAAYVGQVGRDLLRQSALYAPNTNITGDFLLTNNSAWSNYNALQVQYRRPVSAGLQAILNYTWSHSLDNASNDVIAALPSNVISAASDYGSSDFDARHSFSGALTYDVPPAAKSGPVNLLTRNWSVDTVIVARSGFPFNGTVIIGSPDPGLFATSRPDRVPGQPLWIAQSGAPGGKVLNPAAFSVPSTPRQGNEGRNDIPGFGLTQVDLTIGRKFSLSNRFNLQFRADAFNVFNHPNFTNPAAYVEFGEPFLQSTNMLNQGLGGLNPLFQQGGPRSLQLSLKLTF